MKKILLFETKRCIKSKEFRAACCIGLLIALGHFITYCIGYQMLECGGVLSTDDIALLKKNPDTVLVYPACLYEGFVGGEAYTFWNQIYMFSIPLLAALPFGSSFYSDNKNHYLKMIYVRVGKIRYLFANIMVTFLFGGVATVFPYVLSFLLNGLYIPAIHPNEISMHSFIVDKMFLSEWYFDKPWLYFGAYFCILFIAGGAFSLISLLISFPAKNKLLVLLFPFALNIVVDYIFLEIGLGDFSICRIINPMSATSKYSLNYHLVILLFLVCSVMMSLGFIIWEIRKKKIC